MENDMIEELDPFEIDTGDLPDWIDEPLDLRVKPIRKKAVQNNVDPTTCHTCFKRLPENSHGLRRYCDATCQDTRPEQLEARRKYGRDKYRAKMAAQGHIVIPRDQIVPRDRTSPEERKRARELYAQKMAAQGKTVKHRGKPKTEADHRAYNREQYRKKQLERGRVVKPRKDYNAD
jgi:hypothetical protein